MSKVALVTGAASGIGRATALAFAKAGARVALLDRDVAGLEGTAKLLETRAGPILRCDVTKAKDVQAAVAAVTAALGPLDWAFNGAGISGPVADFETYSDEDFDQVVDVNLRGVWLCMKAELGVMAKGGSIVNCASVAGTRGLTRVAGYVAAKHAVVGLTQAAALEYAPRGIRINAVCPGATDTPMLARYAGCDGQASPKLDRLVAAIPVGRIARPEEIAAAVVWLCSNEATYLTGHALPLDGGWCAQ